MIGLDNDFSTLENVAGSWLSLGGGWLKNLSRTTILPASFDGCGGKTSTQGKRRIFNGFDVSQRERESSISFHNDHKKSFVQAVG